MFLYQETRQYFAQISGGLEELGAAELTALGATDVREAHRGIRFTADPAILYRVNYRARLVSRVLAPLVRFGCHNPDYLYRRAREIDWTAILRPDQTFAVFANLAQSKISHSQFASLRVKDAVADRFREHLGKRPNVDTQEPDLWIHLHLARDVATVSLDTSGGSLHRRGYRQEQGEAPMQETVAAAILDLAGWDGGRPLYDPMCGAGTLLGEATLKHARVPAGFLRARSGKFGFTMLPDFDARVWHDEKQAADGEICEVAAGRIRGSDVDPRAVGMARRNLGRLPGGGTVPVFAADFRDLPALDGHVIVCNPPYGLRMGKGSDIGAFYGELGDFLKQRCTGSEAYVYFGDRELIKKVGLRPAWKRPLSNGGLDGRLVKYDLY
ncbi:MAG: THUMP domain-containing protein [Candidatus Krumholzibacteriia bacterium]